MLTCEHRERRDENDTNDNGDYDDDSAGNDNDGGDQ